MNKIKVINLEAKEVSQITIDKTVLVDQPHKQAMFDQVIAEDAGKRQGTHSTLTKAEVRGGGKKPVAQKHTGRARQGSTRNPHMVGGGVCFGPKPTRNYKLKINSKVSKLAFKSALTLKVTNDSLFALEIDSKNSKYSTKLIANLFKGLNINDKKVLIVTNDKNEAIIKSAANIEKTVAKRWEQVSTKDLLNAQYVIYQKEALENLMEVIK